MQTMQSKPAPINVPTITIAPRLKRLKISITFAPFAKIVYNNYMTKFTKDLINDIGDQAAIQQFSALVARISRETGQTRRQAIEDLSKRIIEYRKNNPPPLTAYERILDDVAHGRPRPNNFDASGP